MENKKSLIVGFTSSIGRAVAENLLKRGTHVVAFSRDELKTENYSKDLTGIEHYFGNALNSADLEKAIKDVDTIYYCVNIPYPRWYSEARELLAVTIDICVKNNIKLVFPGNVYVYGKPQFNPVTEGHPHFPCSKKGQIRFEMEQMIKTASFKNGIDFTITRFPDFYGPYVINGFTEQLFINSIRGKKLMWPGDLNIPVDFIYIEDAAEAMVTSAQSSKGYKMYFNVPGIETTAKNFLTEISKQGKNNSKVTSLNSELLIGILGLFDPMIKEVKEMIYLKQIKLLMSGELYKSNFGTLPATPYEDGIRKTFDWLKKYYKL